MSEFIPESQIDVSTQTDFETNSVMLKVSFRAAFVVVVPREWIEDHSQDGSLDGLKTVAEKAVTRLAENLPCYRIRPDERALRVSFDSLMAEPESTAELRELQDRVPL